MSEEFFDIVNDCDEVIGRLPRAQVHREGRKHRAVHVLVFNARGEVFLQKRSPAKDTFPGSWDSSCSGHLASGEGYAAAAARELIEELGLVISSPPRRLFKIPACEATGQEFVWVYRLESEGPFVLHPGEIERGEWFTPARIAQWLKERPGDFAGSFPLIWRKMLWHKTNG
jgi:isopentenyl-diphosphate delta-isomerase type 1